LKAEACGHGRLRNLGPLLRLDAQRAVREAEPYRVRKRGWLPLLSTLAMPGLTSILAYRVSHWLHVRRWGRTAQFVATLNFLAHKVTISPGSCIGAGFYLPHPVGVIFHGRAGDELTLFPQSLCIPRLPSFFGPAEQGPELGDRVRVGVHAVLRGAIRVGADTSIAFGSIVSRDVPAGSVVASRAIRPRLLRPTTPAASPARDG
jgi:serine O-acetyltransferase